MPDATHDSAGQQSPNVGHTAPIISRRPAWADDVRISQEAIDYTWSAPTVPIAIEPDGSLCRALVDLVREDVLMVNSDGVAVDPGEERIFLLDTNFDLPNARLLAAAILECCNRLDTTAAQR